MCRVTESIQKQHGNISVPTSHFTSPHHMVTTSHQDTIAGQDNDHLHLTDSHFSQDDQRCDNSSSLSHDTGSFSLSNTISSVDLTTWGPDVRCHNQSGRSTDTTAVWSQREEDWRERVKFGKMVGTIEPSTCSHLLSTTEGSESICQMGKLHEMSTKTFDGEARLLEGGEVLREKALEKEAMARRMEEQKNRAFRSAPRRLRPRARVPTLEQMNDQVRNDQPNKTESGPGPASRTPTVAAAVPTITSRAQGTGTASRVPATHVGAAITDAASSSTAGVCSDGSHSTGRGNATCSNGVDIRGDAAKDLAKVVRDGSTPEGQRLREQLWVWLHLQDEEAT